MKRTVLITGLFLFLTIVTGWALRAGQEQMRKLNAAPSPSQRVGPARKNDPTGKTVQAVKAFLATLDHPAEANKNFLRS